MSDPAVKSTSLQVCQSGDETDLCREVGSVKQHQMSLPYCTSC